MLRRLVLIALCALAACIDVESTVTLDTLVLRDSTYLDPATLEPYTGTVERFFQDDPDKLQLRAEMTDGTWNGEIVVYHPNGRVRYQGSLAGGVKCGAWIENRDSLPPGDVLTELRQDVEAMGLYPECPER